MKIDAFEILFQNPKIRICITQELVLKLRKLIEKNHKSFLDFARNEKLHLIEKYCYTPLNSWLKVDRTKRFSMPSGALKQLMKRFDISKDYVFQNIEFFQVRTGKRVKVPRWIEVDRDFMYGIGLYTAEGKNRDKRKYRVGIANSDLEIIKFAINWLEKYLGIKRNLLRLYVTVHPGIKKEGVNKLVNNLMELQIPKENVLLMPNPTARIPCVDIAFDSKLLRYLVEWLRDNLVLAAIKNKILGLSYAQGIMDGEGHIRPDYAEIIIEMYDLVALDVVELVYRKFGISPNRSKNNTTLMIETRDFPKLKEMGAFRLHKNRRERFEKTLSKIKSVQVKRGTAFLECLRALAKSETFRTAKSLTTDLNYSKESDHHILKKLKQAEKVGYVEKLGRGKKFYPWKFKITNKGKMLVKEAKSKEKRRIKHLEKNILNKVSNEVKKWASA